MTKNIRLRFKTMRHIFLSPHMDDAVLSAGSLILQLIKEKKDIVILTVFTSFGTEPVNQDAQNYITQSEFSTLVAFSRGRQKEDKNAMNSIGVLYRHLNFIDGGFRKNKKGKYLYPTHENLFSGSIASEDLVLLRDITEKIISLIHPSDILYAPVGIGNNADHVLIRRAVETFPNKKYYWMDQPYGYQRGTVSKIGEYREVFRISHNTEKVKILSCYHSQLPILYPKGIPPMDEVFFEKPHTRL